MIIDKDKPFVSIILLYIIMAGGLCYLVQIPSLIRALLALPSLLILPYLVGKTLSLLLKKYISIELNFDVVSRFIIVWCIGLIFTVTLAYFLNYFWLFDAEIFVLFLIILMIPTAFYKFNEENENNNINNFINNYGGMAPILLSILIGIIMSLLITHFAPYPYTNAVDYVLWNDHTTQMIDYNFFKFLDVVLLGLPILNLIPTLVFNIGGDSLILWWASRFIFYPLYSFGLFIFSYEISKNKNLSLIAAFVGTFIAYNEEAFMFLYHTAPKNIVFLIFPLFLFFVHKIIFKKLKIIEIENRRFIILFTLICSFFIIEFIILFFHQKFADFIGILLLAFLIIALIIGKHLRNNEHSIFFLMLCMITVLLFFHIGNGFFASFFILSYIFISFLIKKQPMLSRILIYSIVISSLLFFLLQILSIIEFKEPLINIYGGTAPTPIGFEELWNLISNIYHPIILSVFFMGVVFALFYNKKYISLIFLVSIMFFIFLFPIKNMYRMLMYLHPFIAFFCAYSLIKFYDIYQSIVFSLKSPILKNIKPIFIGLIIIIFILSPITNCIDEINKVTSRGYSGGYFTMFPHNKFLAFNFIKNNISKNTIVLSRETRYAGYSKTRYPYGIDDITNHSINDELVMEMFLTNNAKETYEKINTLVNDKSFTCHNYDSRPDRCRQQPIDNLNTIVIVDWLTKKWIREKNTNKSIKFDINKFYNTTYFTLLYTDEKYDIYIFGVNPEPGVPFKLVNNSKS